jgi:hypothetical protein
MTVSLANSGVAASQNLMTYEFHFAPTGALDTNGSVIPLARAQAAAASHAYLCVGLGDLSTAKITAAQMSVLTGKDIAEPVVLPFAPKSAELAKVATGLKAFTDEIEANADGAQSVVFCVGGIEMKDVVAVTVFQNRESGPAAGVNFASARVNPVKLYEGVVTGDTGSDPTVLGSNNKLVKAVAGTEVDLDTDGCVFSPRWKFVAGCFTVGESDNLVLAAGQVITLRIVCAV